MKRWRLRKAEMKGIKGGYGEEPEQRKNRQKGKKKGRKEGRKGRTSWKFKGTFDREIIE